ncbi:MAG: hypothetical protein WA659_00645 [Candidatus Aquirickettsiella sp.]
MKYYAALLEGFTPAQEEQLTCVLFNQLCIDLKAHQKKSKPIHIDNTNEKIWLKEKLLFHFNKQTRLLETECVQLCKAKMAEACKVIPHPECNDFFKIEFSDFFKNLQFATSEVEACMLSNNGLLFSQTARIHKINNSKKLVSFNGIVSFEFAIQQILNSNSGLVFGHVHDDISSYTELIRLLPICKLQKIKILYLEFPYAIFSPLLENFNTKKSTHPNLVIQKLKKGASKLYPNTSFLKEFKNLIIAARDHGIAIHACDVNSISFFNSSGNMVDGNHRFNIGNACMIRGIEWLQFKHNYPKFLLLVDLAHAPSVAYELGVPSCTVGNKLQEFSYLTEYMDFCTTLNTIRPASNFKFFLTNAAQIDQKLDPKVNEIINHWNELIKKIPLLTSIPAKEIKTAKEVYIEYILEKSFRNQGKTSDICKDQQALVIALLTQAIYSKYAELAHPKNWYPLFYCQRPYGIRLAENEKNAFTIARLNDLKTSTEIPIAKLHCA